jgi:hypothetical protein
MPTVPISGLPAQTVITDDDLLVMVNDPAGTPVTQKVPRKNAIAQGVVTITDADHTATAEEDVIFYDLSAGNDRTLTLETAANRTRQRVVKNLSSSTGSLTVEGNGSETIDGALNVVLTPGDIGRFIPRTSGAWESI